MTAAVPDAGRFPARDFAACQGGSPSPSGVDHVSSLTTVPDAPLRTTTQALHHSAGEPQAWSLALPRAIQPH